MADIFISYSSKDKEKADQLSELLVSAGLSVWIDKKSIELSTNWSGEIADGIEQCRAFIILLSRNSAESVNVAKEVSLASHYKKKILPLDLEPVTLSRDLAYHLSGLHRAPMTNIDAIIRAIEKLGLEATQAPSLKLVKETDSRKSLMILPFEDLSPTADNQWFADGLASEMISKLSNIKSLRLIDWNTSKLFKERKTKTTDVAREFSVRYFIEGQVRKFGDQIKISVTLLDIETGDHLWQDSLRGEMKDIFDIQDQVAEKVVEGMKIHLTTDEQKKLHERGTENDEAYALSMKAREYNNIGTRDSLLSGAKLASDAIELDKNYVFAYYVKAFALLELYRHYDRNPKLLDDAESLSKHSLELQPDHYISFVNLMNLYRLKGDIQKSEAIAKEYVRLAPNDYRSYFSLGTYYLWTNQFQDTVINYERALELQPDNLTAYQNLCIAASNITNKEIIRKWSEAALPHYEKHLRFSPDDNLVTQWYSFMLYWSGRPEKAKEIIDLLLEKKELDPRILYNIASFQVIDEEFKAAEPAAALVTLRRSIEGRWLNAGDISEWREMKSLKSNPNFLKELEDIIQLAKERQAKTNG